MQKRFLKTRFPGAMMHCGLVAIFALFLGACQPQPEKMAPRETIPSLEDTDTWVELPDVASLADYRLQATGASQKERLANAISNLELVEKRRRETDAGADSPVLLLRLGARPANTANVKWLASGGKQQLINLYLGYGSGPGACLFALLPEDDGDADDDDDDQDKKDGKTEDDEKKNNGGAPPLEAPDKPEIPEKPIILFPNEGARCGTISTIRSLLKMKWIKPADAVNGVELKQDYVKGFDKYLSPNGKGLNLPNQEKAHKDQTPSGKTFQKKDFDINDLVGKAKNEKSWGEIEKLLATGWDCINSYIIIYDKPDGTKGSFGHAEMVTKVTRTGDDISVDMEDALSQGSDAKGIKRKGKKTAKKYNTPHKQDGKSISPIIIQCYSAS